MNKKVLVNVKKCGFSEKISKGIGMCSGPAGVYALCASGAGLGIEQKKCENEFKALKLCLSKFK